MLDKRFPVLGTDIPVMLGRSKIMGRLWRDLTKVTPSNLSVVGPRFVGKTVLINALAQRTVSEDSPYEFALYWHQGHIAPSSNEDFVAQLCRKLRDCMAKSKDDTSEYRNHLLDCSFGNLAEVVDLLDSENRSILMLWDGFDKPLGQGKLTGHVWDQMRTLFYGKKHKIVTATREPLSNLIRSDEAISSPFWNIFDMNPVRIGPFDDEDREAILGELSELSFQKGAKTELINWSSGFPPLFLEVLNHIISDSHGRPVDNEAVNSAASKALESVGELISILWNDCSAGAQELYFRLVENGEQTVDIRERDERKCLIEKGFAHESGRKLTASCRMLQEHIQGKGAATGTMALLFGTWEYYKSNIRGLLERRLGQIPSFDDRLCRLVARAIQDIPLFPDDCLNNLTSIEERALDLIWQKEFGSNKVVPQEILDYWNQSVPFDKTVRRLHEQSGNLVPGDRGLQCGLLQLLTGSRSGFDPKAQHTSKDTYVLINAIHSFRNRGQHSDGQEMHVGVAVAAIMLCLELLSCLERELGARAS